MAKFNQMLEHRFLDIPFDPTATGARQASVVRCSVTQDIDSVRLDEEVSTDDIAGGLTREYLQFLRPWDVWITHVLSQQEGRVYIAREDEIEWKARSNNVGSSGDVAAHINPRRGSKNLDIPFDSTATETR